MAENENYDENNLHYFEGVEKLLEIWFISNSLNPTADLRKIPRSTWDALLKSVRCEIISFSRNDHIDAYVLSESSMFVSKRRWILKTCGTTSPLQGLEPLLELAEEYGYTDVEDVFYSRKNFKRPELQLSPHCGFDEEVTLLDSIFENGRAYCFGSLNHDCWYLYMFSSRNERPTNTINSAGGGGNNNISIVAEEEEETDIFHTQIDDIILLNGVVNSNVVGNNKYHSINQYDKHIKMDKTMKHPQIEPDQTIEILMTELDPKIMSIFTKMECAKAADATEKSGINKLIPGMVIDDYLFEPCGYSMNGIGKNVPGEYAQGCYMTIHITPESEFSYVSFESNVATSNYNDLINRVIETFLPGKFIVSIFANKTSPAYSAFDELDRTEKFGDRWQRHDIQYCRFKTYDLTYAHYSKFPS